MPVELRFAQIDAFASRAFEGNQACVIPLDAWLADEVLQAIGEENNVAETAFIVPDDGGEADYHLRWFTPAVEVALCGHATLASGHFVLSAAPRRDHVRFRTRKAGILEVRRAGTGYELDLPAWQVTPKHCGDAVAAIGAAPLETFGRGSDYSLFLYGSADEVRALRPDFARLAGLGDVLFIATAPGDGGFDVVSRVFAPGAGINEDPVTGAAHAILTPFWSDRLGKPAFRAFQASKRGGVVECRLEGDRAVLGGCCVTVIEGTFAL